MIAELVAVILISVLQMYTQNVNFWFYVTIF